MAKKIDDFYRKALWLTNLTTNDFPFIYASGGAYSFHEALHDVYNRLIDEIISTGGDYFMEKATFNLQPNQPEYIFPTDLRKLREIELAYDGVSWARAVKTDVSLFPERTEASMLSAASTSNPYIDILEDSFFIYPELNGSTTVSSGGKIFYIKTPSEATTVSAVSAASATISFPQQYEYLIPLGVATELWTKFGDRVEKGADYMQKYEQGILNMKTEIKPRARPGRVRMRNEKELGNTY